MRGAVMILGVILAPLTRVLRGWRLVEGSTPRRDDPTRGVMANSTRLEKGITLTSRAAHGGRRAVTVPRPLTLTDGRCYAPEAGQPRGGLRAPAAPCRLLRARLRTRGNLLAGGFRACRIATRRVHHESGRVF